MIWNTLFDAFNALDRIQKRERILFNRTDDDDDHNRFSTQNLWRDSQVTTFHNLVCKYIIWESMQCVFVSIVYWWWYECRLLMEFVTSNLAYLRFTNGPIEHLLRVKVSMNHNGHKLSELEHDENFNSNFNFNFNLKIDCELHEWNSLALVCHLVMIRSWFCVEKRKKSNFLAENQIFSLKIKFSRWKSNFFA